MRLIILMISALIMSFFLNHCGDDPAGATTNINDYVIAGVGGNEPSLSFPEETGSYTVNSEYSYNNIGQIIAMDLFFTFIETNNTYDIKVKNIERDSTGKTVSYSASVSAEVNGKTISGTINYP